MSTDRIKGSILYALHIHDRYIAEREILESVYVIFKENVFPIVVYAIWRNNKLGVDLFDKNPCFNINCTLRKRSCASSENIRTNISPKGIKDVIVCDLFGESHPVITDITKYLYLKSYTIGKELYRLFYYGVEKFMIKNSILVC